ncbi:MAG: [LysW]-lysine hydrolase [Anaerolineaceae bacterium]|nr:[LysW]-lysine hydrolase [Anaerolineaceae bacterium]
MKNISETLLGLVSNYSPSGQEKPAVQFLLQRMQALGFERTFQDKVGNAVGIIGQGPHQLMLLGHIDTVPGEIPIRIENGVLYARGSVDAKGPLAAFVDAVAAVGVRLGWQMIVIGAVGEETDSRGARYIVDQYRPDMVIIGEPSAWERITLGYKGCAHVKITARRSSHHSASGQQTACEAAAQIWQDVQAWTGEYNEKYNRRFEQAQTSLLKWSSGTNGFENRATLEIEARLPLALNPVDWFLVMKELAGTEEVQTMGFPIQAYRSEKNSPLVRSFLKAIRGAGGKPDFVVKTGTADMNIVAPVWQCPAVAYGPGDSSLDHTPQEHLSLEEYENAVTVLKKMLKNITD